MRSKIVQTRVLRKPGSIRKKWCATCVMCGDKHTLEGKKPKEGAKFLCPDCMVKVQEKLNEEKDN